VDLGYGAEAGANFAVNVANGLVLALVAVLALETSDSGVSDTSSTLVVGDGGYWRATWRSPRSGLPPEAGQVW
jgi:hypothetical protein